MIHILLVVRGAILKGDSDRAAGCAQNESPSWTLVLDFFRRRRCLESVDGLDKQKSINDVNRRRACITSVREASLPAFDNVHTSVRAQT